MKAKELKKFLKEKIKEIRSSRRFLDFLSFCGSFHNYSLYNLVSIYLQKPDATFVAGIKTWNKWGRRIKKGEKGIPILAPLVKKEVVIEENGEEREIERLCGFKTVYVWDVSQTEGKPLPLNFARPLDGKTNVYKDVKTFVETTYCPVVEKDIPCNGMTDFRLIVINRSLSEVHKLKTLLHELAHFLLHEGSNYGKNRKELEAETSAYLLMKKLGIDTSSFSFDYLTLYSDVKDEEFEKAIDTAVKLSDDLAKTFVDLLKKTA